MTIALQPGEHLSLPLDPQATLRLEVNWDADPQKTATQPHHPGDPPSGNDLDANALILDAQGDVLEVVWFRHRHAAHDAVRLSGDDRSGEGQEPEGDESITVELAQLDPQVTSIVFTINNYGEGGLASVRGATCRLIDARSNQEIARSDLTSQGAHNALILASLTRHENAWHLKAIGVPASGKTYWDTLPEVLKHL